MGFVDKVTLKNARTIFFGSCIGQAMLSSQVQKSFFGVAQRLRVAGPNPYPIMRPLAEKTRWGCFTGGSLAKF